MQAHGTALEREHRGSAIALAAALAATLLAPAYAGSAAAAAPAERLVVTAVGGVEAAARAVVAAGGRVLDRIALIGGVVADLPHAPAFPPGVSAVSDRPLQVTGADSGDDRRNASTIRSTLGLRPTGDEGKGVVVAVVDTGVAQVGDLSDAVLDSINVTRGRDGDGYGHGTFMAGLVAGSGKNSGGRYTGVAPGARILDVKVADAKGSTSLSLVLKGLQAVADDGRAHVLNLSLSSESPLPYQIDPLTVALEELWYGGVTVVVSAGNEGPDQRTITSPGLDPVLLTVASVDENYSASRRDDTVPSWSSRGPAPQGVAKPDLAAPGAHVVSVRAPGSAIDRANPSARVEDDYFRGSGTSMSAAVASGAVAALLEARPELTPDQVKSVLTRSAYDARGLSNRNAAGTGGLDLAAAYDAKPGKVREVKPFELEDDAEAFAAFARAWAAGDWKAAARAWAKLSPDARAWAARAWAEAVWDKRANSWSDDEWAARAWAARAWAARAWAARAWAAEEWLARAWAARAWADEDWAARAWGARAWSARAWAARAWSDHEWAARAWSSEDWSARAWSARAWSARAWAARAWSDESWSARAWSDEDWSARAWSGRAWSARAWSARAWSSVSWGG